MILTVPVFLPLAVAAGINPIFFGIFVVMMIEIGMLTPPVGMNVFTVKSMNPSIPISVIFQGTIPFLIANFSSSSVRVAHVASPIQCNGLSRV
jgi:TRAP-type C4-dicarboxylate transport system permease large subunit